MSLPKHIQDRWTETVNLYKCFWNVRYDKETGWWEIYREGSQSRWAATKPYAGRLCTQLNTQET